MRARVLAVFAVCLVGFSVVAACIDGVTPDCSNPSVCAPIEGDAAALTDDAAPEAEAPAPETGAPIIPDASADARDAADSG